MRFSISRLRGPAALAAACGVLAAGCTAVTGTATETDGETTEPVSDTVAEAQRLYQVINQSSAVEDELTEIEHRVAKRCMDDAGFQVHDPAEFQTTNYAAYGAGGYLTDAPVRAVPTPEAAAQWGFGLWTDYVHNPGNEDLAEELLTPEARLAFNLPEVDYVEPDSSEWDAEGEDYQAEWIEAYTGAPAVISSLKGPEADWSAPLGGCKLEMIETIYGEPYIVDSGGDDDGDGENDTYTASHPPSPAYAIEEFEDYSELVVQLDGEIRAFETCLIDGGHEGWELGEYLYPPLWEYFGLMYDPVGSELHPSEEDIVMPELPEEVPTDFMGVLDLERAMAVDFAACGQESGLRAAIEEGWATMLVDAFAPIETEIVGWQEDMRAHLDNAQDYLQE